MSSSHVVPVKTYLLVFAALIFFTGLTTGVAYIDMGAFNTVVALAIAVVKMLLVVLFFMHVKYSTGLLRIIAFAGIFWLAILVTLTLADILTRHWSPASTTWGLIVPGLRGLF